MSVLVVTIQDCITNGNLNDQSPVIKGETLDSDNQNLMNFIKILEKLKGILFTNRQMPGFSQDYTLKENYFKGYSDTSNVTCRLKKNPTCLVYKSCSLYV